MFPWQSEIFEEEASMHSRAFLLLRRDLINLQKAPLTGISASPTSSDSVFHWSAKIEGLGGTEWEGGVFQVTLSFSEAFNTRPPEVHFMTIPFHPNVDPSNGRPSLHILQAGWSEDCGVATVLLALQAMLGSPEPGGECVSNRTAAKLMREAPHTYRQMALDCVTASLRIDAGLTPYELEDDELQKQTDSPAHKIGRTPSLSPNKDRPRRVAKPVSFDDYHTLWKGIATSVTAYQQPNKFTQLLTRDDHLCAVHCSDKEREEKQKIFEKNLEELSVLKYGKVRPLPKLEPQMRRQRIEELKHMYREGNTTKSNAQEMGVIAQETEVDEIEELVQWTKNLNDDQLES